MDDGKTSVGFASRDGASKALSVLCLVMHNFSIWNQAPERQAGRTWGTVAYECHETHGAGRAEQSHGVWLNPRAMVSPTGIYPSQAAHHCYVNVEGARAECNPTTGNSKMHDRNRFGNGIRTKAWWEFKRPSLPADSQP